MKIRTTSDIFCACQCLLSVKLIVLDQAKSNCNSTSFLFSVFLSSILKNKNCTEAHHFHWWHLHRISFIDFGENPHTVADLVFVE